MITSDAVMATHGKHVEIWLGGEAERTTAVLLGAYSDVATGSQTPFREPAYIGYMAFEDLGYGICELEAYRYFRCPPALAHRLEWRRRFTGDAYA